MTELKKKLEELQRIDKELKKVEEINHKHLQYMFEKNPFDSLDDNKSINISLYMSKMKREKMKKKREIIELAKKL